MDDRRRHDRPTTPDPDEGVRIMDSDESAHPDRRPDAQPRRPEPPADDASESPAAKPRPAMRFPQPSTGEPTGQLPHWTEPATGEVPQLGTEPPAEPPADDDLSAWSSFATGAPRWRDQPRDWEQSDFGDPSQLADDETRVGALDSRRKRHDDLFDFNEPEPARPATAGPVPPPAQGAPVASVSSRPTTPTPPPVTDGGEPPMGRNVGVALITGLAFAAAALFLMSLGPAFVVVLVAVVITMAAAELYGAIQKAGYQPATLVGLVTSAALVGGAYWRGEAAYPIIIGLGVITSFLWFLTGVSRIRPAQNASMTVLGILYVGTLGSFASLILRWPGGHGSGILIGAIVATVAYDTGGFFIGRQMGQSPLAPEISPNKTYEGLVGGMGAAVAISVILVSQIGPWDFGSAIALGLVASVAAPIGDLIESMIKRDLGVKDTGSILPGHGGLLDRFDGLLFVLPAVYYLARVLDLGLG